MVKVLVADDSLFMRNILNDILSDQYEIVEADSGLAALRQVEHEKPDLTLLDIIMPEGEEEGIKTLRSIMEKDPEARVVMITAVGQEAIMQECYGLGAKGYITKPFDPKLVLKTVEECLNVART